MSDRLQGVLIAMLSSAAFGTIPLFTLPALAAGLSVSSVLFYRMFFGWIVLSLCLSWRPVSLRLPVARLGILLFGALLYASTALFLLRSYETLNSGVATTVHFLYPVGVALLMILFFREPPAPLVLFSMLLSLGGVALLCYDGNAFVSGPGLGLALLSVCTYALYIVTLDRSSLGRVHPLALTFYLLLFSSLFFGVAALFSGGIETIPSVSTGVDLLLLGLVCTVVSNLALIVAVQKTGPTLTAALGTLEPLTAVLIGLICFGEPFGWKLPAGIALIVTAVLFVIRCRRRPAC